MFSFHKPKKPSIYLNFSVNLRADSDTINSDWIHHLLFLDMHAHGNSGSKEMDASYTMKAHCDSKEGLLREFDKIWMSIPYLCGKFPNKVSEMKFQLTLKGSLGKAIVDELYTDITDLSAFHDFLRKHDLIPLDKLQGKLKLDYSILSDGRPLFMAGGRSVDISVADYQQQLTNVREQLNRERQILKSPLLIDKLSLTVVGRIDAQVISAKFDNMDSLEKYLDDKFNHKVDHAKKASPF